jgi:hypothetical protein
MPTTASPAGMVTRPLSLRLVCPAAEGLGRSDKSLRFVVVQVLPGALLSTRRPAIA